MLYARRLLLLLALVLAMPLGASAGPLGGGLAAPIATVDVWTGGVHQGTYEAPLIELDIGVFAIEAWVIDDCNGQLLCIPDDFTATINLFLDADPEIVYSNSVLDFGAPTVFAFSFQQAIVDTQAPGDITHDYSASGTDGGDGTYTATPTNCGGSVPLDGDAVDEISIYNLSTNGGTTLQNAGLDFGGLFSFGGGGSSTHGPFNSAVELGPAPSGDLYNFMQVDVCFGLNGGNDSYTFNGRATVFDNPVVPEPATALLTGLGLLGLGWMGRRSRA